MQYIERGECSWAPSVYTGNELPAGCSYDEATNTLTLNGFDGSAEPEGTAIDIDSKGIFTIKLLGDNKITTADGFSRGICALGSGEEGLHIVGPGSLTISSEGSGGYAISSIHGGELTVKDCSLAFINQACAIAMDIDRHNDYSLNKVVIDHATLNVNPKAPGREETNSGICAGNACVSITNESIVNMNFVNGYVEGIVVNKGWGEPNDPSSGKLNISKDSEVTLRKSGELSKYGSLPVSFQKNGISSKNVYVGDVPIGKKLSPAKAFGDDDVYYSDDFIMFAPHTWDKAKVLKKATAKANGKATYSCTDAGCTETIDVVIPPQKFEKAKTSFICKASTLAKKAQVLKVGAKASGKVSYKATKYIGKAGKYLKVSSAGKLTVKKGTPKGTYRVKVKFSAKATKMCVAISTTKTITVKVK